MNLVSYTQFLLLAKHALASFCMMLFAPLCFANLDITNLESQFRSLYKEELETLSTCSNPVSSEMRTSRRSQLTSGEIGEIKVCSDTLRNDENAPYILLSSLHDSSNTSVVVLLHGLSDSPYYLRSIAEHLHNKGHTVIVPLLPGHGKKNADQDMQAPNLMERWRVHLEDIMNLAYQSGENVYIGGFSAGGTLATDYLLRHALSKDINANNDKNDSNDRNELEKVRGLILFSGALQLSKSAEAMSSIWGMKKLAVWLDGDFKSQGPNPYRYPKVASYSGLLLMDVIEDIRDALEDEKRTAAIELPIFAAHSLADALVPYDGVEALLASINSSHTEFKIDKAFDVCHRDILLSPVQMINFEFDKTQVNQSERCAVPKANPQHNAMLFMLEYFVKEHSVKENSPHQDSTQVQPVQENRK